jgi:hypothetical protein
MKGVSALVVLGTLLVAAATEAYAIDNTDLLRLNLLAQQGRARDAGSGAAGLCDQFTARLHDLRQQQRVEEEEGIARARRVMALRESPRKEQMRDLRSEWSSEDQRGRRLRRQAAVFPSGPLFP